MVRGRLRYSKFITSYDYTRLQESYKKQNRYKQNFIFVLIVGANSVFVLEHNTTIANVIKYYAFKETELKYSFPPKLRVHFSSFGHSTLRVQFPFTI